jgi:hypothetical protein
VTPDDYMAAARVPHSIEPQEFGLWTITRLAAREAITLESQATMCRKLVGFDDYTLLHRFTASTIHLPYGEIVMEDSKRELRKHLPIWMTARGRVLVTGLGLGCVVRGLLANQNVDRIDVVEIDRHIIRVIGPEFTDPRVTIHQADALKIRFSPDTRFDFAWHDIWSDTDAGEPHLQSLHAKLLIKYRDIAGRQGAWAFPREFGKMHARRMLLIGVPKQRNRHHEICRNSRARPDLDRRAGCGGTGD